METQCPSCLAIWGMEEIEEQHCGACGWPNNEEDYDDYYADDYENDY